jgi:hypothetical protein
VRRRSSRWIAASVAAVVAIGAVTACRSKPTAGQKCPVAGQLVCAGGDRALVCESNAWVAVACKGPRGCARPEAAGATEQCDDTLGVEGEPCPDSPPLDYACTADHAEALVCRDGRFALWRRCRGPRGCEVGSSVGAGEALATDAGHEVADAKSVRCDTSAGAPGDPCERRGSYACSTDGKTMLVCAGTSLMPASSCRGPSGCRIDAATSKVDCDDTVAEIGDPCDEPRRITCANDHKAELVCVGAASGAASSTPSPGGRPDGGATGDGVTGTEAPDAGAAQPAPAAAQTPPPMPLVPGHYEKKRECRRSDCSIGGSELFCD